jgi:uncharacterized repeat protein (TIGR01451 family)
MNTRFPRGHRAQHILIALLFAFLLLVVRGTAVEPSLEAAAPQRDTEIPLRVQTPTYTLDGNGLSVPGYDTDTRPGAPALPVWNTLVELPSEGEWALSYQSVSPQSLAQPVTLLSVPVPDPSFSLPGDWAEQDELPESVPMVEQPDPAIYGVDALYPAAPVVQGQEQWQSGRRLLALQIFPFQYNPVTGQLLYHPDILVSVRVTEPDPARAPAAPEWTQLIPQGENRAASAASGAARVYTSERGIYRLTYSDLQAAGVPVATVNPATFAISYLGEPIAIEVTGEGDGQFNSGDLVLFYAEPYTGRYMTQNVYWLTWGGSPGLRMGTRDVTPAGTEPTVNRITRTLKIDKNQNYLSDVHRPSDADHWYDRSLSVSSSFPSTTRHYDLQADTPMISPVTTGEVQIRAVFQGITNQAPNPDNSIVMQLNGRALGSGPYQWDGASEFTAQATAPASWLDRSPNRITLVAALSQFATGQGPNNYSIYPDTIEIVYPSLATATSDRLYIEAMAAGRNKVAVSGFSAATGGSINAYDLRNPRQPVRLLRTQIQPATTGYNFFFWDDDLPSPTYYLSANSALLAPASIQLDTASNWRSAGHNYDYIAIVHSSLSSAVQPLLNHRQAEGLRVAKVDVQDIYDEFSAGRVDQEAIRAFLAYAYHNWNGSGARPEYVLLVGDGHFDPKGHLYNVPNLIPPYLADVDPWLGETAADNRFVSVDGPGDYLPDMHIGRIPARDALELQAAVNKIIGYETGAVAGDWQKRVVYVADNHADPAGNFHSLSNEIRQNWLPPGYDDRTVYYRSGTNLDTGPEMESAINAQFNEGVLMLQWFGHGGKLRWGYEQREGDMFSVFSPAKQQENTVWPLTVSFACWSHYFINPRGSTTYNGEYQSLGEMLLLAHNRGSVAEIGPTGLHIGGALLTLDKGLTRAIFQDRIDRVGPALDAAKLHFYTSSSGWHDVLDTTILLGDPATRLRLPPMPRVEDSQLKASTASPYPGSPVTFSVEVVNNGNAPATNGTVSVDYDQARLTINSASGAANDGDKLTWQAASLPVGTTTYSFVATVKSDQVPGTLITTSALIRTAEMFDVNLNRTVEVVAPPPSPTPTNTATATNTPLPTSTPFVVGLVRNPQGASRAVPSVCGTDGMNAPSPCISNASSGYFASPAGRSQWGVWMQATSNEVVIGVTPVPGGGTATLNGSSAQYVWPRWTTGRRDARFVVATVTPSPTASNTPMPSNTPTQTPTRTPTPAVTATSTPFVVGLVRNPQGVARVVPSVCGSDGVNAPSPCISNVSSGYFASPAGRNQWGVRVQVASNEVIIGVTPVPGGGTATLNGSSAQYVWPRWTTGRKDVRFVVATVTPGLTSTPSTRSAPIFLPLIRLREQ